MRYRIRLPSFSCQTLLFDYLSFCKSNNTDTMKSIFSTATSLAHAQCLLEQEFYHLFMKKFPKLKYLDMKPIRYQIFHHPEAMLRFESLCELKCDTSIDSSYFYSLAHISQYIQRLIIVNTKANGFHGIAELIGVQKNLKYFEWRDEAYLPVIFLGPDRYKEILFALEKSANIIIHLNIFFQFMSRSSPKVFPKFHKLKRLRVGLNSFSEEQLKMCVYHDLEILETDYYELKAASIIIENSGGHLKKIYLYRHHDIDYDDHYEKFNEYSLMFIRKVYEKCLSIEYLSLEFPSSKQHFNEFEKLLKICQNLKSLILAIYTMDDVKSDEPLLENGKELLKLLVRSAPTNLREIRILFDVKFSLGALKEFLEKWRGRPALSILIYTRNVIYKKKEKTKFIKLINIYKNNGVIKDLRCECFKNVVNLDYKI
ncbi:unnamed protein product [Rhizophagus irregularis]|nr:unnamed protein product [Rhizophagus irregularis]